MNNMYNTAYSVNEPSRTQQSHNQTEFSQVKTNKSFIDNKPMIQGLVRSVLKI